MPMIIPPRNHYYIYVSVYVLQLARHFLLLKFRRTGLYFLPPLGTAYKMTKLITVTEN